MMLLASSALKKKEEKKRSLHFPVVFEQRAVLLPKVRSQK